MGVPSLLSEVSNFILVIGLWAVSGGSLILNFPRGGVVAAGVLDVADIASW